MSKLVKLAPYVIGGVCVLVVCVIGALVFNASLGQSQKPRVEAVWLDPEQETTTSYGPIHLRAEAHTLVLGVEVYKVYFTTTWEGRVGIPGRWVKACKFFQKPMSEVYECLWDPTIPTDTDVQEHVVNPPQPGTKLQWCINAYPSISEGDNTGGVECASGKRWIIWYPKADPTSTSTP